MAGPVPPCRSLPSCESLASETWPDPSALPCHPWAVMPPPATVRLASCAAGVRGTSEAIAMASAEQYTRRISCPFICVGHHPDERGVYIDVFITIDISSRRDFLQVTAGAGAFASLTPPIVRHTPDPTEQP